MPGESTLLVSNEVREEAMGLHNMFIVAIESCSDGHVNVFELQRRDGNNHLSAILSAVKTRLFLEDDSRTVNQSGNSFEYL